MAVRLSSSRPAIEQHRSVSVTRSRDGSAVPASDPQVNEGRVEPQRNLRALLGGLFELESHNVRLTTMEGMRGIAILLVFLSHYNGIVGERLHLPAALAQISLIVGLYGASGVDLFFVLSGFLIYAAAIKPNLNLRHFLQRRIERIYPTFLVVFAIYLLLVGLHAAPSKLPHGFGPVVRYLIANVLLLPGMFDINPVIAATWSLSYEFAFYIVLPLLALALRLSTWRRRDRIFFFAACASGYMAFCLSFPQVFPHFTTAFSGTHVRLVMFIAGILAYELLQSRRFVERLTHRVDWGLLAVTLAGAAIVLAILTVRIDLGSAREGEVAPQLATIHVVPTFVAFFAFALLGLRPDGIANRFLNLPALRWTGNISYSFYLVHSIPMHVVGLLLLRSHAQGVQAALLYALAFPLTLALVYVFSAILFVFVEKPLSLKPRPKSSAGAKIVAA